MRRGALLAAAGMACVGSSVAVSTALADAPLFTTQALRYLLAAAVLWVWARAARRPLPRPRGAEWAWLAGIAATGLVLFNVGVVRGVTHAEPAVVGVAIAAVPVVLAVLGPLAAGTRPAPPVVVAAVVVTVGALLVQGGGRTDAAGLGWAALVLATECAFTLLAVPVLGRLGPWAVSLHAVWMGAVGLAVLGVAVEGPAAVRALTTVELLAAVHLALVVTALAFVLWYSAVGRVGAGRAGLFTGVVPVTAAAGGVLLGGPPPGPAVWAGIAVVAVGLALGTLAVSEPATRRVENGNSRGGVGPVSPGAGSATTSAARTSP